MRQEAQIITLANQKGGVGKTTTCHVLAYGLAEQGKKVLVIDMDPQCNLTESFALDEDVGNTICQVFRQEKTAVECVYPIMDGIDLLPGSLSMASADMEFSFTGREYILMDALEDIKGSYDSIIIDTPPTLGVITINALAATDQVIVPVKASKYSVQGLSQLMRTIALVKKRYNRKLELAGVLITQHEGRSNLRRNIKETLDRLMGAQGVRVFNTVIRSGVAVEEAQYNRSNPLTERPKASVTEDYRAFIREFTALYEEI